MLVRPFALVWAACLLSATTSDAAAIEKRDVAPTPSPSPPGWGHRLTGLWGSSPSASKRAKKTPNHLKHLNDNIVLRFNIEDDAQAQAIARATNTLLYLDVWCVTQNYTDIRIPKGRVNDMLRLLPESMQHSHTRLMHNLAETAFETFPAGATEATPFGRKTDVSIADEDIFFQDYQTSAAISAWQNLMAAMFPQHVELLRIGETYEKRDIHALKVGRIRYDGKKKPTVLIVGAAHAREWISVSSVNFMAHSLITGYGLGNKNVDTMVDEIDWIFIPTLNVDGYVYTWEYDRLWRKNRQPTSMYYCKGIDLDRAYDFHFDDSRRTANNPCSDSFPGTYAFEATEAAAFDSWVKNYTSDGTQILGLLDFHAYSQQILYPYSFTCSVRPPHLENLRELGIGLAKAIRLQSGEHYEVTSACEGTGAIWTMMAGSGSMMDYFYEKNAVRHTFQIKLRDTGNYGFLLPKDHIIPTGEESWSLLKYFAQFVLDDGSPTGLRLGQGSGELVEGGGEL